MDLFNGGNVEYLLVNAFYNKWNNEDVRMCNLKISPPDKKGPIVEKGQI